MGIQATSELKDAIDPELIKLPRQRTQIRPLTSLALIVFCGFLLFRLWPDTLYSLKRNNALPVDVSEVGPKHLGEFVSIRGDLDFSFPVVTQKTPSTLGSRWARVLGTSDKLWAALPGNVWLDGKPTRVLEGRVRALRDLPQFEVLAKYIESNTQYRILDAERFAESHTQNKREVVDVFGDTLFLKPKNTVEISYNESGSLLIDAFRTENFNVENLWRSALIHLDLIDNQTKPVEITDEAWTYLVATTRTPAQVNHQLRKARLFAAKARKNDSSQKTTIDELTISGDEWSMGEDKYIETRDIESIAIEFSRHLENDTMGLVIGDEPSNHKRSLWGSVFLVLSLVFFLWNLIRELRDVP